MAERTDWKCVDSPSSQSSLPSLPCCEEGEFEESFPCKKEQGERKAVAKPEEPIVQVSRCSTLGLGLRVSCHVKQHDVVFSEKPLLTFTLGDDVERLVQETLSAEDKEEFYSLYDATRNKQARKASVPTSTTATTVEKVQEEDEVSSDPAESSRLSPKSSIGVCVTNALALEGRGGLQGILRLGSRINHSCSPNVGYRFDGKVVEFYAYRDLEPQEEIFISYIDHVREHKARQALLETRYGFTCHCPVCSLTGRELDSSEKRRGMIRKKDELIFEAIQSQEHQRALQHVQERLDLLNEEACLATPLNLLRTEYDALCISQELECYEGMRKWVSLAIKHAEVAHGKHSPVYTALCNKVADIRLLEALSNF